MQQEIIIVIASVIIILLFMGVMFLLALVYFNARKRKMLAEKKRMESAYTEELLKTKLEIQEETFRTISQEIHDNIGQNLTLLKLTIVTVDPQNSEQVTQSLDSCKQMVSNAIKDVRNLAHSLNPDFLDHIGLPGAIKQQLEQLEKTNSYTTSFEVSGYPEKQPSQKELVLLRVVQELLNNTLKHAEATTVAIHLHYEEALLTISVSDNGKGFDMGNMPAGTTKGIGLLNIQNRVKMIGGKLTLTSAPGKGTRAIIEIPPP